jgi:signal transduction histidine kinase
MPEPAWYRSLYWRIALGFVALLATLLVVQGSVFLWMTGRMTDFFPNRSPAQFAATVAADVSVAMTENRTTDISAYVNRRYSRSSRGFVVVLDDGRVVRNARVPPPPGLDRIARMRLAEVNAMSGRVGRPLPFPPFDGDGDGDRDRGGRRGWFPRGFGRGGPVAEFAAVTVQQATVGMVAVPIEPPPMWLAVQDLGPTLAAVALVLLAAGTAVSALVIFRPVRLRLQELQNAARAIGAGQTGIRAPDAGGDEVSSLARTFNEMAIELEERARALENANRVRRQLLADVSHELMTPLAAIRGYVETLRMEDRRIGEEAQRRYLRIVNEEAERLEHIIGDLLDLARLEGGGGSFRVERVALDQLLARVRDRHEQTLREKSMTLQVDRDPALDKIHADPNRLEQALQNLVANAIRHTPDGGTVRIRARPIDDVVSIVVEDSGPGIPPEHLARVFDRFYKVDESRAGMDTPSGSGLGLSIVRAIVARHGGTIEASNAPGAGARFEIRLPANPAPVDHPA